MLDYQNDPIFVVDNERNVNVPGSASEVMSEAGENSILKQCLFSNSKSVELLGYNLNDLEADRETRR